MLVVVLYERAFAWSALSHSIKLVEKSEKVTPAEVDSDHDFLSGFSFLASVMASR